eukprot:4143483-Pleurochrysis_carterae.AAC.2
MRLPILAPSRFASIWSEIFVLLILAPSHCMAGSRGRPRSGKKRLLFPQVRANAKERSLCRA